MGDTNDKAGGRGGRRMGTMIAGGQNYGELRHLNPYGNFPEYKNNAKVRKDIQDYLSYQGTLDYNLAANTYLKARSAGYSHDSSINAALARVDKSRKEVADLEKKNPPTRNKNPLNIPPQAPPPKPTGRNPLEPAETSKQRAGTGQEQKPQTGKPTVKSKATYSQLERAAKAARPSDAEKYPTTGAVARRKLHINRKIKQGVASVDEKNEYKRLEALQAKWELGSRSRERGRIISMVERKLPMLGKKEFSPKELDRTMKDFGLSPADFGYASMKDMKAMSKYDFKVNPKDKDMRAFKHGYVNKGRRLEVKPNATTAKERQHNAQAYAQDVFEQRKIGIRTDYKKTMQSLADERSVYRKKYNDTHKEIAEGLKSGKITAKEAVKLERQKLKPLHDRVRGIDMATADLQNERLKQDFLIWKNHGARPFIEKESFIGGYRVNRENNALGSFMNDKTHAGMTDKINNYFQSFEKSLKTGKVDAREMVKSGAHDLVNTLKSTDYTRTLNRDHFEAPKAPKITTKTHKASGAKMTQTESAMFDRLMKEQKQYKNPLQDSKIMDYDRQARSAARSRNIKDYITAKRNYAVTYLAEAQWRSAELRKVMKQTPEQAVQRNSWNQGSRVDWSLPPAFRYNNGYLETFKTKKAAAAETRRQMENTRSRLAQSERLERDMKKLLENPMADIYKDGWAERRIYL